jgi:hypothetical protein
MPPLIAEKPLPKAILRLCRNVSFSKFCFYADVNARCAFRNTEWYGVVPEQMASPPAAAAVEVPAGIHQSRQYSQCDQHGSDGFDQVHCDIHGDGRSEHCHGSICDARTPVAGRPVHDADPSTNERWISCSTAVSKSKRTQSIANCRC